MHFKLWLVRIQRLKILDFYFSEKGIDELEHFPRD